MGKVFICKKYRKALALSLNFQSGPQGIYPALLCASESGNRKKAKWGSSFIISPLTFVTPLKSIKAGPGMASGKRPPLKGVLFPGGLGAAASKG
jgi:hypothetical protein